VISRRALLGGAVAVLAVPLATKAQQARKVPLVGIVASEATRWSPLRDGLRELGYVEGQNIAFALRVWESRPDRVPDLVGELIQLKVDVIVSNSTPAIRAAKQATRTIPIVMMSTDPVGAGLVASLARPGGNVTGLSSFFTEMSAKRLELLKEVAPRISRVAVLWNPTHPGQTFARDQARSAGRTLGLMVFSSEVRRAEDLSAAFATIAHERADALFVLPDPLMAFHRKDIADFAVKQRIPSMYAEKLWVDAGGLIAYGSSFSDQWRRAAGYVDKILKGAKPGDLPVEQPTRFELVINLKTAKALGLTIPPSLLLRADQIVE